MSTVICLHDYVTQIKAVYFKDQRTAHHADNKETLLLLHV